MQRDTEAAVGTARESQARLDRRVTLRALESTNYAQYSYSRNTFFPGPRHRSRASSRDHAWSPKNRGIWWDNFYRGTSGRCQCTRWYKGCSTRQSHSISAKSAKLSQQSSSSMIFCSRRPGLMTQAGWAWQTQIPMGGTLHHDRSDTRRSLSTTRQENGVKREQPVECRATTTILCINSMRW
jgi:hypothetical protein